MKKQTSLTFSTTILAFMLSMACLESLAISVNGEIWTQQSKSDQQQKDKNTKLTDIEGSGPVANLANALDHLKEEFKIDEDVERALKLWTMLGLLDEYLLSESSLGLRKILSKALASEGYGDIPGSIGNDNNNINNEPNGFDQGSSSRLQNLRNGFGVKKRVESQRWSHLRGMWGKRSISPDQYYSQ